MIPTINIAPSNPIGIEIFYSKRVRQASLLRNRNPIIIRNNNIKIRAERYGLHATETNVLIKKLLADVS